MQHRTVHDLMTLSAAYVDRDAGFKQIAEILAEHDITALPVVDDDEHPVGVVSELVPVGKAGGTARSHGSSQHPYPTPRHPDSGRGRHRTEPMTSPAIAARPEWGSVAGGRARRRAGQETARRE